MIHTYMCIVQLIKKLLNIEYYMMKECIGRLAGGLFWKDGSALCLVGGSTCHEGGQSKCNLSPQGYIQSANDNGSLLKMTGKSYMMTKN